MQYRIKKIEEQDFTAYLRHMCRHFAESGKGDIPIFDPDPDKFDIFPDEERQKIMTQWEIEVGQPHWRGDWGVWVDSKIVAHMDLRATHLPSMAHRALFGIGVESEYFRQGIGAKLIQHAIDWCREHKLTWLDLRVFAHNTPAIKLYEKFGFEETGRVSDLFRVRGQSIDDISMSLKL